MPLRLLPIFLILGCTQLGLWLAVRTVFFPRPEQWLGRRLSGGFTLFAALCLPAYGWVVRNGVELGPGVRFLVAYPLLSWNVMAMPLLVSAGVGISIARRWRKGGAALGSATAEATATDSVAVSVSVSAPVSESVSAPAPAPAPAPLSASAAASLSEGLAPEPAAARFLSGGPPLLETRRLFLARASGVLFGGAALAAFAGVNEAESAPEVTRHQVVLPGLHPDLEGLSILQLSDIHAGALVTEERMAAWAVQAAALAADLVVFTGDLLDGSGRAAGPYARAFAGLHGKLGTYSILGNHDYYAGKRFAVRGIGDAGQVLLLNSGARVTRGKGSLWICGVDDPIGDVDPDRALRGAAPGEPKVMLAHRPSLFHFCAESGADLVLSGHTHGGQFALSPTLTPARMITRYTMGEFAFGKSRLYVHRGMGTVGAVPLRLGSRPELALLILRGS